MRIIRVMDEVNRKYKILNGLIKDETGSTMELYLKKKLRLENLVKRDL